MEENQELLLNQIIDLHGKVVYTYTTHHKIQNRLERINKGVKISQIILTAVSTVGFLATVITNQYLLAWIGGITSALSLGLNSIKKDGTQKYVVERIRNSLMHGNFNIEATSKGEILVIFTDTYNKRSDVIRVPLNKLKVFLCQPSLYVGIPSETNVMLFQRQDI